MTAVETAAGPVGTGVAASLPRRRISASRITGLLAILLMLVFGVYSLTTLDFSWSNVATSARNAVKVFGLMDPISLPGPADLAYLIGLTLGIVLLGTLVAAIVSIPVAYVSAANTAPAGWLRVVGRAIGVGTRAVPDVVLALAFSLAFALGSSLPGILAIGIHSIGMISKLFADAIEQIDRGPQLAVRAAGGSKAQEFWAGVFPQVLPSWIATVLHRFDINLRGSVILGYAGVGGLGYAMRLAFDDFPAGYGRGLGIAAVIFVLCVVLEIVSSTIRRNLLGVDPVGNGLGRRIAQAATRTRTPRRRPVGAPSRGGAAALDASLGARVGVHAALRRPWTRSRVRNLGWGWTAVAVVVLAYWLADVDVRQITWNYVVPTMQSFWPPNFGSHGLDEFAGALLVTVEVAFGAAVLSLVLSLVIGSLAARNVAPNNTVRATCRTVLVIFRGVPELVLAIFLIMVTGLGNQAGVVALAFGGIGLLGKLVADSFEEIPPGPERALSATGATRTQRYLAATWPQGLPSLIGNTLYLVDTNLRAAVILGIVGGSGVGFYLVDASSVLTLHGQVTTLVIMVFATVLVVEAVAAWLRRVFR